MSLQRMQHTYTKWMKETYSLLKAIIFVYFPHCCSELRLFTRLHEVVASSICELHFVALFDCTNEPFEKIKYYFEVHLHSPLRFHIICKHFWAKRNHFHFQFQFELRCVAITRKREEILRDEQPMCGNVTKYRDWRRENIFCQLIS